MAKPLMVAPLPLTIDQGLMGPSGRRLSRKVRYVSERFPVQRTVRDSFGHDAIGMLLRVGTVVPGNEERGV